jgi:hypothetical protein
MDYQKRIAELNELYTKLAIEETELRHKAQELHEQMIDIDMQRHELEAQQITVFEWNIGRKSSSLDNDLFIAITYNKTDWEIENVDVYVRERNNPAVKLPIVKESIMRTHVGNVLKMIADTAEQPYVKSIVEGCATLYMRNLDAFLFNNNHLYNSLKAWARGEKYNLSRFTVTVNCK